jgi:predicted MFS family arabinose efflux permease
VTYAAVLLITCVQSAGNTILSPFLRQFELPLHQVGYFLASIGIMRLISRVPTGAVYAPCRSRRLLFWVLPLMAATQIGYARLKDPFFALLCSLILGATQGISTTVLLALTIDLRPRNRSTGMTMGLFAAAIAAGFVIGNSGTGFLADRLGFEATFILLSFLPLLAVVPVMLLSIPESEERLCLGETWQKLVARFRDFPIHWRRGEQNVDGLDFDILWAVLIGFQISFVGHAIGAFFPLFALSEGLSLTNVGVLMSTASLFSFLIRPIAFLFFHVSGYITIGIVGVLLSSFAMMLFPESSFTVLFALFAVIGLMRGVNRVVGATIVAEGDGGTGIASGIFNAGLDLGALSAPAVAGWLASWIGVSDMFRLLPVLLIGFFLLALVISKRIKEASRVVAA